MACKIAVMGALGRMGRVVTELALADERFDLVQLVESPDHPKMGALVAARGNAELAVCPELSPGADVAIDFTSPAGFRKSLVDCVKTGTALVSGTTGLGQGERDLLVDSSSIVPCFHAPNMSIGIEVLSRLVAAAAGWLPPGFDVEIVEVHHNRKADAPSGTALRLLKAVESRGDSVVHGRQGAPGPRKQGEIGMHAIRGGDVVGEHTVLFLGKGERIELVHKCTDRSVFAAGSLEIALKIHGRKPGLYTFADMM